MDKLSPFILFSDRPPGLALLHLCDLVKWLIPSESGQRGRLVSVITHTIQLELIYYRTLYNFRRTRAQHGRAVSFEARSRAQSDFDKLEQCVPAHLQHCIRYATSLSRLSKILTQILKQAKQLDSMRRLGTGTFRLYKRTSPRRFLASKNSSSSQNLVRGALS